MSHGMMLDSLAGKVCKGRLLDILRVGRVKGLVDVKKMKCDSMLLSMTTDGTV